MTRYSRNVVLFRWALIAAIIGLLLTAIIRAWPKPEAPVLTTLPPKNELTAPRFVIKQGAYTHVLTGSQANYSPDQQIVKLQHAKLESQNEQQLITITTSQGVYNKQTAQIALEQGVQLTASASQLTLQAEQGLVDTRTHQVTLDSAVHGTTPTMEIKANQAVYVQAQQLIQFKGNVHVTLQP